jgi:hypothetical protein
MVQSQRLIKMKNKKRFKIKFKIPAWLVMTILLCSVGLITIEKDIGAADDAEIIDVNLDVSATIANACDASVTMGSIVGTGQSALTTNEADCVVITNNSAGYDLTFTSATAYLENANSDQIAAYTPAVAGTPDQWSVASSASEWGAHLKSTSTSYDSSKWGAAAGTENYAASDVYWHNVTSAGSFSVANKTSETTAGGDTETIMFGAEVGSSVLQPTGTYDVNVTVTATTN